MNDFVDLLSALVAGALLGILFYSGLWWTVRQLGSSKHVVLLFMFSMLLRTSIVISGFYLIMGDNWQRLLVGLLGFIIIRILATRLTRLKQQSDSAEHKTGYAP